MTMSFADVDRMNPEKVALIKDCLDITLDLWVKSTEDGVKLTAQEWKRLRLILLSVPALVEP